MELLWIMICRGRTSVRPSSPVGILREMYKQSNLFVGNDPVSFREGRKIRWHIFQRKRLANFMHYRLLSDFS